MQALQIVQRETYNSAEYSLQHCSTTGPEKNSPMDDQDYY